MSQGVPGGERRLVARLMGRKQPRLELAYEGERIRSYSLAGLERRRDEALSETLYANGDYLCLSSGDYSRMLRWSQRELRLRALRVKVRPGVRVRVSGLAERLAGVSGRDDVAAAQ